MIAARTCLFFSISDLEDGLALLSPFGAIMRRSGNYIFRQLVTATLYLSRRADAVMLSVRCHPSDLIFSVIGGLRITVLFRGYA